VLRAGRGSSRQLDSVCTMAPFAAGGDDLGVERCVAQRLRATQWRKDSLESARLGAQQGLSEIRRETALVDDLCRDLAGIAKLTEAAATQRKHCIQSYEVMRQSIDAAHERSDIVARVRDQLCEAHEVSYQELQYEKPICAQRRQSDDDLQLNIDRFLGLYRDRLGLDIARVAPSTVRLTFTLIDKADPAREFSFTLGLAAPGAYHVSDCTVMPPQLGALLERLNGDSSPCALARFVSSMRRAFQELAGTGAAH